LTWDAAPEGRDAYPGINTIPNNVAIMQKTGYVPVASFILPEYCWIENFFAPQEKPRIAFLEKHKGNAAAEDLVANQVHEEKLYHKYKEYYGYVFYIGKKI
jgi:hypothetical protein